MPEIPDEIKLFRTILDNPSTLLQLPVQLRQDKDFLELYYILLGDEIAPYFPEELFQSFLETEKVKRANTAYLKDYEEFATGITKQKRNAPN